MEEQLNTTSLEEKILETNLPIRKEIVASLEELKQETHAAKRGSELKTLKERWESLGVPLEQEKELIPQFENSCSEIEKLMQIQQQEAQVTKESIQSTLKTLEKFLKDQESLNEISWQSIQVSWHELELEDDNPHHQQFLKLEPKIIQKLKRQEHEDKCAQLQELCTELEQLKSDRDKKLSERQNKIRSIRDRFKAINLHSGPNVVTLREKFSALNQEITQELSWERWSSSKRKEDLIQKATQLLETGETQSYRDELQKLQTEWKEIGFTSRDDDKLWEQFKNKCDEIFQKLKVLQDENEVKREGILKQLEALKDSSDWKNATEKIQQLQKDWNQAYPVSRKAGRKQGQVYKDICDTFFNRRREHQKEVRSNQKDNLKEKKLLIEKVVKLHSETNWKHSLPKVKDIQAEWKKTGPVPKKLSDDLWKEFQEACNVIYDKRRAENEVIDKEFEANAEEKMKLLESLKVLVGEADLNAVKSEMQKIEKKWQEIGKVPRSKQKSIEHEYRVCIKNLNDKEEQAKKEKHQQWLELTKAKAALCHNIEALMFSDNLEEAKTKFEELKAKYDDMGVSKIEKALKKRYRTCVQFFESDDTTKAKEGLDSTSQSQAEIAESIIFKLEKLVGIESKSMSASTQRQMMIAELQAKMGKSSHKVNKVEEAENHLSELQSLGPIQPEAYQNLHTRIEAALAQLSK